MALFTSQATPNHEPDYGRQGGSVKNELIKFAPLFAGLTDSERELLAAGFIDGQSAAQSTLLKAGERSDAMYLIGQGFVSLSTQSGTNLATLGPGSLIGDAGLFRNAPQDVNAVALSELHYWQLTDRRLREMILQQPSIGLKLGRNFGSVLAQMEDYLTQRLSKVPELTGLPVHTYQLLAARMHPREIKAKDAIYRAGDAPLGLFLVENGAVELRSESEVNGEKMQSFGPGTLFGGSALLTGKPYAQSAVATQDSMLWALSAEDFATISHQNPGLRRTMARSTRVRLSKADQSQVVLRLVQMPLFAEASPQSMQAIAQRMVLQHAPAGERVYMVGDSGDAMYFIESGEVELTAENDSGAMVEVARVSNSGYFGDESLLTGQSRTEDATATRNTNLWILYKTDLDALAAQHQEIGKILSQDLAARLAAQEKSQSEERFRKFELLSELGTAELKQIADHLHPMRYRTGEQIYRASSPAETLYLLEKGQVRIQPLSGAAWVVGGGEAFGERALLTNQPHNTSASAETDVDVWTLSKIDFDMLMNRYPMLAISMSRMLSQRLGQSQTGRADADGYLPYEEGGFEEEGDEGGGYATSSSAAMAGNIPSRRRRAVAEMEMRQTQANLPPASSQGFGSWFSSLTLLQRIQLAVLIVLIIFVIFVVAPLSLLSLLQGTSVARGAELGSARTSLLNAINAVYAVGSYELASQDKDLAEALAMADKAVPPTPTYTPGPTFTPIPTSTPLPTATFTPVPTATPPPTAAPFIQQFIPPTAEATAVAEVAAAAPPRAWDPRLDRLGVRVEDSGAAPGQQYWRLIDARWADEQESGGKHHIYVEVLDENGNRIVGHPVTVWWGDGSYTSGVEDKAPPDYGFNYMMYAAGNSYNIKVEGLPSEIVYGAGMGDIERPKWGIHTSIYLVFQKATK
jgi:CRP-like cAMP-binding protein